MKEHCFIRQSNNKLKWFVYLASSRNALKACRVGLDGDLKGTVVTNTDQEIFLQHRSLAGALLGCLPQCAWGLLLMFSAPVPRTIREQISLKTALIYLKHCIVHQEINAK
jgi:hypothetical protein